MKIAKIAILIAVVSVFQFVSCTTAQAAGTGDQRTETTPVCKVELTVDAAKPGAKISPYIYGKFSATTEFAANDHRNFNRNGELFNVGETFAGLEYLKAVELSDALKSHVPESMPMAQMAIRWILDFEAVSVIIPGATRTEQVVANVSSAAVPPLSDALHQELGRFYQTQVAPHIRGPN